MPVVLDPDPRDGDKVDEAERCLRKIAEDLVEVFAAGFGLAKAAGGLAGDHGGPGAEQFFMPGGQLVQGLAGQAQSVLVAALGQGDLGVETIEKGHGGGVLLHGAHPPDRFLGHAARKDANQSAQEPAFQFALARHVGTKDLEALRLLQDLEELLPLRPNLEPERCEIANGRQVARGRFAGLDLHKLLKLAGQDGPVHQAVGKCHADFIVGGAARAIGVEQDPDGEALAAWSLLPRAKSRTPMVRSILV